MTVRTMRMHTLRSSGDETQLCVHRYFSEMAIHALNVLRVATLELAARDAIAGAAIQGQRPGMATLLSAAGGQAFMGDHEVGWWRCPASCMPPPFAGCVL